MLKPRLEIYEGFLPDQDLPLKLKMKFLAIVLVLVTNLVFGSFSLASKPMSNAALARPALPVGLDGCRECLPD